MKWDMSDPIEKAIFEACEELRVEHDWGVTDNGEIRPPFPDEVLPTVLRRFFSPLCSADALKEARIAALKAEIAQLEAPNEK